MDTKAEKITKLLELLQNDTITPKQVEQFLTLVLGIVKNTKEELSSEFETVSHENLRKINEAMQIISEKHYDMLKEFNQKTSKQNKNIDDKFRELKKAIEEVRSIEVRDGKDADEERIVEDVLSRIPKHEEIVETPEEIRDKLESLKGEDRLDASAIKNLPEVTNRIVGGVVARNVYQLGDVKLTNLSDNQVLVYDAPNRVWVNENQSGGAGGGTLQEVTDNGNTTTNDIEITSSASGIILKSADGTRWRIGITNAGELTATSL